MYEYCRRYIFDFSSDFWHDRAEFESWHKSQCVPVPKSGDFSDPNNWRGVMLMDIMSKIFSYVINAHCLDILDDHRKNINLVERPRLVAAMVFLLSGLS